MPDITEVTDGDALSSAAERASDRSDGGTVASASRRSTRLSDSFITVPVSLPVGTLVTGTTFNLITSDQLPHFKPMLCVDNGFVSGSSITDEIKSTIGTTSPLLEDQKDQECNSNDNSPLSSSGQGQSWNDTANMPILPVRCKNTSAELHKNKLGSGGRGKCIKYNESWYTPSEFEALCGRGSSKDWKRSIRFGGRSIQALIAEGVLKPHATSCTCGACCDDQTATGPVRLFIPYKRKKRDGEPSVGNKRKKVKSENVVEEHEVENHSSNSNSKETWQSLADGLETNSDYHLLTETDLPEDTIPPPVLKEIDVPDTDLNSIVKRLEQVSQSLIVLTNDVRQMFLKQTGDIVHSRASPSLPVHMHGQIEAHQAPLHASDDTDVKKCANCNHEAMSECSLCRRTPYCSAFCQKKDWPTHQIECLRNVPTLQEDSSQSAMRFHSLGGNHPPLPIPLTTDARLTPM
ncbi:deformed epidermal autoregulatory factor 1 isoform X2 [Leptidea sinapis]|uniref:deformed epidermal autoregulatory factor 1 isoform X2 n=1 Tax=Leptidea sinapis TaxID=189913 RepID=UPI0021C4AFDE|nr:deformed epidermal autoregulatory factor 1 isoform X2 [Leptidea sinapis]